MVVLAKALSGGLVPVQRGADVGRDLPLGLQLPAPRHHPHLDLQREQPGDARRPDDARHPRRRAAGGEGGERGRAAALAALRERLSGYEMVGDIRGLGLLSAIEFRAPRSGILKIPFAAFHAHPPGAVRPDAGDEPLHQARDPEPDLRQQLPGPEGGAAAHRRRCAARALPGGDRGGRRLHPRLQRLLVRGARHRGGGYWRRSTPAGTFSNPKDIDRDIDSNRETSRAAASSRRPA